MTIGLEKMIVLRQHVYDLLGRVQKSEFPQAFLKRQLSSVSGHVITRKLSGHVITEIWARHHRKLSRVSGHAITTKIEVFFVINDFMRFSVHEVFATILESFPAVFHCILVPLTEAILHIHFLKFRLKCLG
jgi:hypothetical protein